jgi:hypothetical protein
MYDHFKYTEKLARQLIPISHTNTDIHFFRATLQTELKELNEKLTRAHGMIMIAIDEKTSDFSFNQYDSMMERPSYSIVIAKQTKATDTDTIFQAQLESKGVILQVISRMMADYQRNVDGCELIDPNSFKLDGFGPIGDLFYGIILDFYLDEGVNYKLNPAMWK